ncbi:MAG TPA: hypothetical protein VET45_09550 [Candidatus Binatia bacterium]|nr:hypothetical protein [Candidatus Binatia bacterium]
MSRVDERTTATRLLIVARPHPDLYEYLRARFCDDANVTVILDRRLATRRRRPVPAAAERRRTDRRSQPEVDTQLRAHSLAIVAAPSAAAAPRDVRQWLDAIQSCVAGIRTALDDRDRLEREADAIKRENERLRADVDWSRKRLEEVDVNLARAVAMANDALARLRDGPAQGPTG